jgi:hypothetical protein
MSAVICLLHFVAAQNNQRDAGTLAGTPLPYCVRPSGDNKSNHG